MYMMIDKDEALIIDPHINERAFSMLDSLDNARIHIFLTHEHPDHTCGIKDLVERYTVTLICQNACARIIADKRNNRPVLMVFVLAEQDKLLGTATAHEFQKNFPVYECHADITFEQNFSFFWHNEHFEFTATPGHSQGSCCILWNNKAVFTGDSLLLDTPAITRFPGGSEDTYFSVTMPYLKKFPEETIVLPGHGETFILKESGQCGI
jgi:glyoxylase-like metal-dependent hydrolase (beta-lactamase superfamily II)